MELSAEQLRTWLLAELVQDATALHEHAVLRVTGALDVSALEAAARAVVARHEALRTVFRAHGSGEPRARVVLGDATARLEVIAAEGEEAARARVGEVVARRFDLERAPPFRACLVREEKERALLVLVIHRLIGDGARSLGIIARDLVAAYGAVARGEAPALRRAPDYGEHVAAQRAAREPAEDDADVSYFQARLAGAPPAAELAKARARASSPHLYAAASARRALSREATAELAALASSEGLATEDLVAAAFVLLVSRHTLQEDVVLGALADARGAALDGDARAGAADMVGDLENPVPVRVAAPRAGLVRALLADTRDALRGARAHGRVPFDVLASRLRGEGRGGLFRVLVAPAPEGFARAEAAGAVFEPCSGPARATIPYELVVAHAMSEERLCLHLEHDREAWDGAWAEGILRQLERVLLALPRSLDVALDRVPLLSEDERRAVVAELNASAPSYAVEACIHRMFDAEARQAEDAPAILFGRRTVTYGELAARANQIAHRLVREGVGPDVLVGVAMDRSVEAIAAVLGVLKAGGAYVPLDPAYPRERLAFMMRDANVPLLVTQPHLAGALPRGDRRLLLLDEGYASVEAEPRTPPVTAVKARNLAYVIYTSGSTGAPKGVLVEHRGVCNQAVEQVRHFDVGPGSRVLAFFSSSFDGSVFEWTMALLSGAALCLGTRDDLLPGPALHKLMRELRVTIAALPPSALAAMPGESLPSLRTLLVAGEPLTRTLAARWAQGRRLFNLYGPTEATVTATLAQVTGDDDPPPIGRPLANVRVYVLDAHGEPVPRGALGELYIGGAGVARGYLHLPELTAARFLSDPFAVREGGRMYRTGDLVRARPDGQLEFVGRADGQVKVRGFRVELGEVEAALAQHEGVREVAVIVWTDASLGGASGQGDARLVAYVVPREGAEVDGKALRAFVRARLPEHMVPAAFVTLRALPLTPNRKVDRRALPPPFEAETPPSRLAPPRTEVELAVAAIWSEVLGRATIGTTDDFFELGGHSLLAAKVLLAIEERLGVSLKLRAMFELPTLGKLAAAVEAARAAESAGPRSVLAVGSTRELYPVSFAQEPLFFLDRLAPGHPAYACPVAFRVRGRLSVDTLAAAIADVARRHAPLRATFVEANGAVLQRIADALEVSPRVASVEAVAEDRREEEARRLVALAARHAFDLGRGPLVQLDVVRLAPFDAMVVLNVHHIVTDGWSTGVLLQELSAAYRARRLGDVWEAPPLHVTYLDYALWQRRRLSDERLAGLLAFWRDHLEGAPELLELPADRPRPRAPTFRGARADFSLGRALADAARSFARRSGATVFVTLLAAFEVLLQQYAGRDDLVVGVPVSGRVRSELARLVGMFTNVLPLRCDLGGRPSFAEVVARVARAMLAAQDHQDVPFGLLVQALRPSRDVRYNPLVQIAFVLEDAQFGALELPGLEVTPERIDRGAAQFDLALFVREDPDDIVGWAELSLDLFDVETVERMLAHYKHILAEALSDPARPVAALSTLSAPEHEQVVHLWNRTATAYPRDASVPELVAEHTRARPSAVAVEYGATALTYGELDARAEALAGALAARGVRAGDRVGLSVEPGLALAAGMLGILQAGAAYVPLDASYPDARIALMLADARPRVIVTQSSLAARVAGDGVPLLLLDPSTARLEGDGARDPGDGARPRVAAEDLAYVIYTSGSTGRPKGVMVPHRGIVRLVRDTDYCVLGPEDRVAQVSNISFDAATFEVWGALANGGTLVGVPRSVSLSPRELGQALLASRVTAMFLTTSLFNQVAAEEPSAFRALDTLIVGGEALDPQACRRVLAASPPRRLVNGYGPTESTTFAAWEEIREVPEGRTSVPIGRPLANTTLHVLDREGRPLPPGIPGELHIGGDGLALGYLARPELTEERFVHDPFSRAEGARLYRTGDLAKRLRDGRVEYLGRMDRQVKLRGYRIELGEIEAALLARAEIAEAVVVLREDAPGQRELAAYMVARRGASASAGELRARLAEVLPDYMVPAHLVALEALPRTPHGKVDRDHLPSPRADRAREGDRGDGATAARPGRTATEEVIARAFCAALGRDVIADDESFFALGGHSLGAMQILARVERELGVRVRVVTFFEEPTVAGLARAVDAATTRAVVDASPPPPSARPPESQRPGALSFAQEAFFLLDRRFPGLPYNVAAAFALSGPFDASLAARSLRAITERQAILRTTYAAGPAGDARMVVGPPPAEPLRLVSSGSREEAIALAEEEARRPFDLAAGPAFRALAVRIAADEHVLVLSLPHIAGDGASLGVLLRELSAIYGALARGEASPLGPLSTTFSEVAAWQRRWLAGGAVESQLAYWREALEGAPRARSVPGDRAEVLAATDRAMFDGAVARATLPAPALQALKGAAAREGVTVFVTVLAALGVALSAWTGERDVVVGTTVSGRDDEALEHVVGCFINRLALRFRVDPTDDLRALLGRVRRVTLEALDHQDVPFEVVEAAVAPGAEPGSDPLFRVAYAPQETSWDALALPSVRAEPLPLDRRMAPLDLILYTRERDGHLEVWLEHRTRLYSEAKARGILSAILGVLTAASAAPALRVAELLRMASNSGAESG